MMVGSFERHATIGALFKQKGKKLAIPASMSVTTGENTANATQKDTFGFQTTSIEFFFGKNILYFVTIRSN